MHSIKTKYETADGKLHSSLHEATEHSKKLANKVSQDVEKYLNSYHYRTKPYKMDDVGVWEILGEDPNCDMGGPHYQPKLGYLDGYFEDVLAKAVTMSGFYSWGAGGTITKVTATKV